jgi:hypothetical protein
MAPIIPAGGKRMDWAPNAEPVEKKAQGMFDDDPQLQAIKDLPGMKDGIDELESMSAEECTPCEESVTTEITSPASIDVAPAGNVEQAIEKVKDAAQGVADAAVKDVEKAVAVAVADVGKAKVEEIAHEVSETPAEEKKEHEKSETPAKEEKEEEKADKKDEKDEKKEDEIPGVKGDIDGIEKEGDEGKFAGSSTKLRRIAELAPGELKDLRNYWENLLGFPKEYVDAMLKSYKA